MKPLLKGAILALCLMQVPPVMSASFASRSSFKSSAGFAARSPAYRPSSSGSAPVYRSFRPETGSRTAGGASGSASASVNSASSAFRPTPAVPRSLLSGSGPRPSARLQTIIREKEASGPGWVGTAALVWLLSRHDLSSGDRAWINERLREANNNTVSEPDAPVAEQSDVRFQWAVPALIVSGQPVKIVVTADRHGKALVPACGLGDIKSVQENNAAVLNWTPGNTFSAVATCRAEGWVDQRLLAVSQTSGGKL